MKLGWEGRLNIMCESIDLGVSSPGRLLIFKVNKYERWWRLELGDLQMRLKKVSESG